MSQTGSLSLPQSAPAMLPTAPLETSRALGWRGLIVERYQYPGAEYKLAPLAMHTIVLQLGPPLRMGQQRDGKTNVDAFLTNQIAIVPAGMANHCWHTEPVDAAFVLIDPRIVVDIGESVGADPGRIEMPNNFGARDPQLQSIMLALLQEAKSSGLGGRLYVESLTNQLALHLLRYYAVMSFGLPGVKAANGLPPAVLQTVLELINDRLSEDLSLADLAAAANLSPYHFARLFKQSVGKAPHQYLIQQRVEAAKRLLSKGLPTALAAAEAGFSDYSHLARHFKRLVGVPPAEYRQSKNRHS